MKKIFTAFCFILVFSEFASAQVNVTFRVNMQGQTVSPLGVHLAGDFQGWQPDTSLMTLASGTTYEKKVKLTANTNYEFKFVNGNDWGMDETVPGDCATGGNRTVHIGLNDTVLTAYCYATCAACIVPGDSVNLTVKVDMQGQIISPNGVHVAGSFQGWNTTSSAMILASGTTYTKTFRVPENATYQYKFLNGNDWPFVEAVPALCGKGNDLNREVAVGTNDTVLSVVCFSSCTTCVTIPVADSVNVTFRVNMQGQTVSPLGVHIAGLFQNWEPGTSAMTLAGGTTYTKTFKLPKSTTYEYKFVNGNDWGMDETVPGGCATNNNRTVAVGTKDTTLQAYCYGSCTECNIITPPGDSINLTVRVDMQGQTISANGVHVAGVFQGWNPASSAMTLASGTTYTKTFKVPVSATYQFKFINGNDWPFVETVPALCGKGNDLNREVAVGIKDTVLNIVCFSSCTTCVTIPVGDSVNVTFRVDMQGQTVSPNGVHMAGNFQTWAPANGAMTLAGGTIYTRTYKLPKNASYEFKFVNGNDWGPDEQVPGACAVNGNRGVNVGAKDTVLKAYCFGSCTECGIITPPGDSVNVIFRVNMQGQTISANGVHIAGSFQGWSPATSQMTLSAGTTYVKTFRVPVSATYQYKFINGNDWPFVETVPAGCGVGPDLNRTFTIGITDSVLPVVCFSGCADCSVPSGDSVNITLKVDMSQENVSADGIHIAGSFQGWSPSTSAMDFAGAGIYTKTFRVPESATYEYKFINGNDWPYVETVPAGCGVGPDLNRNITVGTTDVTANVVCYSGCGACVPQTVVNVTFRVDMGSIAVSPDGVHLMGNFQGWDPTGTELIRQGASTVFQLLIPMAEGDSAEYKFVNGNTSLLAENPPAGCTKGITSNRFFVVPGTNYITPLVCFESCVACQLGINDVEENEIAVYPSPATGHFTIGIGAGKAYRMNIYDSEGRLIKTTDINNTVNTVSLDSFVNGIYTIRLLSNEEVIVKKIMVTR